MGVFDNKRVYLRRRSLRLRHYAIWGCTIVVVGVMTAVWVSNPSYTKDDRPTTSIFESIGADISRSKAYKELKKRL
jgi:hypothetical protein